MLALSPAQPLRSLRRFGADSTTYSVMTPSYHTPKTSGMTQIIPNGCVGSTFDMIQIMYKPFSPC
jgi:hypothetical protein